MKYDIKLIVELYKTNDTITDTAKKYCLIKDIEYTDTTRRTISKILDKIDAKITDKKTNNTNKDNNVTTSTSTVPTAWNVKENRYYTLKEFCEVYGLDYSTVHSGKLVGHNQNNRTYNIKFKKTHEISKIDEKVIEDIVKKHIKPIPIKTDMVQRFYNYNDRLVLTDIHIGMEVNGGRNTTTMYESKWDETELYNRLDEVLHHVKKYKKSDTIAVDDLGDFLDGFNQQTTRGGHKLPQNMDDIEAFQVAIKFKIDLITALVDMGYTKIISNNITNDNHSGVFAYQVNYTVKKVVERLYTENVEYNILQKFISHYTLGKHTFLLCHGKDDRDMRFGFKTVLDTKQSEKIDQYCKINNLYNGNRIEFSKGDSHQGMFDYTTSNDFDYFNYPAFSPASNWVKNNFKNTKSGFFFFNLEKDGINKITHEYWFDDKNE